MTPKEFLRLARDADRRIDRATERVEGRNRYGEQTHYARYRMVKS